MTSPRIAALDFIRGVAVMGIVVANLPAFALPEAAYFSPLAWGGTSSADVTAWFVTFVFVEGRMRGLFAFLFGASMLLVADRATAHGENGAQTHLARMAALFGLGLVHLYLIWWGDILAHYALVGALVFVVHPLRARWLLTLGLVLLAWEAIEGIAGWTMLVGAAARDTPGAVALWDGFAHSFGVPPRAHLSSEIAGIGGSWRSATAWRWQHATNPFVFLIAGGAQTAAAMLLGMAAYRAGFLTGAWPRARYRRWATICLGIALPVYALLGVATILHGFDMRWVFLGSIAASAPFRILGTVGYAAALMLLFRAGGWWSERIAAVGRVAFSNYLGTSLAMAVVFTGLHQFGRWDRAALYLSVPIVWGAMLAWSASWLARYRHGPLEWLWRSMARGQVQPMRLRR